ncbi:hypothetical protein D2917_01470 [Cupriavidus oxalaticus]|uniref:Uncharacterized protein n=1 Tax=Cupriavidus oxalaticus TaxID=96344 RepID=A0A5P3VB53_9BURK|nr:hypothetical protein D2917_01470 [Cupriavidus oxalaticus]
MRVGTLPGKPVLPVLAGTGLDEKCFGAGCPYAACDARGQSPDGPDGPDGLDDPNDRDGPDYRGHPGAGNRASAGSCTDRRCGPSACAARSERITGDGIVCSASGSRIGGAGTASSRGRANAGGLRDGIAAVHRKLQHHPRPFLPGRADRGKRVFRAGGARHGDGFPVDSANGGCRAGTASRHLRSHRAPLLRLAVGKCAAAAVYARLVAAGDERARLIAGGVPVTGLR